MKRKGILFLILVCLFANEHVYAQESEYRVSVIIPCYYGHFKFLPELLDSLSVQTALPDEVIISLSEVHRIPSADWEAWDQKDYPFKILIVFNKELLCAGENRNRACEYASGDVFICQDADDLPHPQRIEIIKHLFENHDIQHLIHGCLVESDFDEFTAEEYDGIYDPEELDWFFLNEWTDIVYGKSITHGNIAITRAAVQEVQWSKIHPGEDALFNYQCYAKLEKTAVLNALLLIYCEQYSSSYDMLESEE